MKNINSSIFKSIYEHNTVDLMHLLDKFSPQQVLECNSDLIKQGKSLRSYSLLEACCANQNEPALQVLLAKHKNWTSSQIKNALHLAIESKRMDIINLLLLTFESDVQNALQIACQMGDLDLVKYLLKERKLSIHTTDSAPIFMATQNGHVTILETLKENGFELRMEEDRALLIAIQNNKIDCARYLIRIGADIHVKEELPLKIAIVNARIDLCQLLIENGAELTKIANDGYVSLAYRYQFHKIAILLEKKLAEINATAPVNTKQSTHVPSVEQSIVECIQRLHTRYAKAFNADSIQEIVTAITTWQTQLEKGHINDTARKVLMDILQANDIDKNIGLSLRTVLILCWIAIHDSEQRIGELVDALAIFKEGLCEIQLGDNFPVEEVDWTTKDAETCESGKFHKLIEKLVGIHPDVEILFISKEVASLKLRAIVREEARKYKIENYQAKPGFFEQQQCINDIWPDIRERVKQKMFTEFGSLFVSEDNVEFNDFVNMGIHTDLTDQNNQTPTPV